MKQHSTDFAGPSISHFGPPLSPDTVYSGTPGNDTIIGTETNDFFNMTDGGSDWVYGLKGNDVFAFGATLNPGDRIDGGEGYDSVLIGGTYPLGIHPGATTLINVEELDFDSQYSYAITMNDGNVGPKDTLVVN